MARIACVAVLTHIHVLWGDWVRDDYALIVGNPAIRRLGSIPEQLTQPFLGIFWRPSVTIAYTVEYALWGLHPAGYHATNLLLHAAAAVLVYAIWRRLSAHAWLPMAAGALFAVHGAHYQPAVIADRTGLLATTGGLFAWWCALRRGESRAPRFAREVWSVAALAAYAVALGAKEEAVMVPALMAVAAFVVQAGREERERGPVPWPLVGVLAAIAVIYMPVRGAVLQGDGLVAGALPALGWRLLSAPAWIAHHWRDVVLPLWLDVDYRGRVWPHLSAVRLAAAWALIAVVGLWAWRMRTRRPEFALGLLLAAWAWLPTSNLIPIYPETAAQHVFMPPHLLYFPNTMLLGAVAAMGVMAVEALGGLGGLLVVAFLALQAVCTVGMNYVWMDDVRLYRYVLVMHPRHPLMWRNLGLALAMRGDYAAAAEAYDASIRAQPTPEAYIGLAEVERNRDRWPAAAAAYRSAAALAPGKAEPYLGLADLQAAAGDVEAARSTLRDGQDRGAEPARLLDVLARIERDAGNVAAAQEAIERALHVAPTAAPLWNTLGTIRAAAGDRVGAVEAWTRAEALAPGMTPAAENLAALDAPR